MTCKFLESPRLCAQADKCLTPGCSRAAQAPLSLQYHRQLKDLWLQRGYIIHPASQAVHIETSSPTFPRLWQDGVLQRRQDFELGTHGL
jgi:hypothetical protein